MNAREKADYELLREVSERLFNRAVAPARNPDALKLGMALREARLSTQQGLAEVARKLDLPENWLAQLEEGGIDVKDIYLEDLVRYADALGLDLELTVQSHDGAFCGSVRTADLDKSPAPASADPEPPAK
jgi:cytoskeletal protein RodZ